MGTLASKAAVPLSRAAPKQATKVAQEQVQKAAQASAWPAASKTDPRVTAQLKVPPKEFHRKTNAEWAETLKNISGAITSSAWEGEVMPPAQDRPDKSRHSAQRSDVTNMKLPAKAEPKHSEDSAENERTEEEVKAGRLTQNQIIALFNLRRKDPEIWNAEKIAERFHIDEEDARDLLKFTRTYMGRMDDDGQTRGYYKTDKDDTVTRFERD